MLRRNDITYIPRTAIFGLSLLRKLGMNENNLLTLPDLFHLPTRELPLRKNPIECNFSLCWIRMSPWFNPPLSIDNMICNSPRALGGIPLMDIHPLKLGCPDGMMMLSQSRKLELTKNPLLRFWPGLAICISRILLFISFMKFVDQLKLIHIERWNVDFRPKWYILWSPCG